MGSPYSGDATLGAMTRTLWPALLFIGLYALSIVAVVRRRRAAA